MNAKLEPWSVREVRLTCRKGHTWKAIYITKVVGDVQIPGGKRVRIFDRVSLKPQRCPEHGFISQELRWQEDLSVPSL